MDIFYQPVTVKVKTEPTSHRIMYNARGEGLFNFFETSNQVSCYTF